MRKAFSKLVLAATLMAALVATGAQAGPNDTKQADEASVQQDAKAAGLRHHHARARHHHRRHKLHTDKTEPSSS